MRKFVIFCLLLFSFLTLLPQETLAADTCPGTSSGIDVTIPYYEDGNTHTISLSMGGSTYDPNAEYFFVAHSTPGSRPGGVSGTQSPRFTLSGGEITSGYHPYASGNLSVSNNVVTWEITRSAALKHHPIGGEQIYVSVFRNTKLAGSIPTTEFLCEVGMYMRSDDPLHTEETNINEHEPFYLCEQINDEDLKAQCLACFEDTSKGLSGGIWTAIGCLPTRPSGIISSLIRLGLSIGGGIALLLILAGAFRLSVSQGEPKQAEEAREQITSAVIGLLFIIFSIVMLRFIGVNLLQIPGFGGS